MTNYRFDRALNPIKIRKTLPNRNVGWMTGLAAATAMIVFGVFAFIYQGR